MKAQDLTIFRELKILHGMSVLESGDCDVFKDTFLTLFFRQCMVIFDFVPGRPGRMCGVFATLMWE